MIGRRSHNRQAERDIDAFVKMQRLQRNESLVMIEAQRCVIRCACARAKHRISRMRAANINASLRNSAKAGSINFPFLVSKHALFPGVGLSPAIASLGRVMPKRRFSPRAVAITRAFMRAIVIVFGDGP